MAIKIKNAGADFAPIPAAVHQAVCYGAVDIGTQKSNNPQHKDTRKLILLFELPFERGDFGEGKKNLPRGTSITLTQSLNEKAILRKMLKSWRGRDFTPAELEGFDPKVLIGINCQLNILHETKGEKTFANITAIMPLSKGMNKAAQENPSLYFSLDDQPLDDIKFPQNMPQWIQKKITFCSEVMKATGVTEDGGQDGGDGHPDNPAAREAHEAEVRRHEAQQRGDSARYAAPTRPAAPAPQENLDEDVPF